MNAPAPVSSPAPADQRNPALDALCVEFLVAAIKALGEDLLDDTAADAAA